MGIFKLPDATMSHQCSYLLFKQVMITPRLEGFPDCSTI